MGSGRTKGPQKGSALGVKGVTPHLGAYLAQIIVDGKKLYLGRYRTVAAAQAAFELADYLYFEGLTAT